MIPSSDVVDGCKPGSRSRCLQNECPGSSSSSHLPTLDGWRALAICGVLIGHGRASLFPSEGLRYSLAAYGGLGVDLFFAISGYLITTRLLEEQRRRGRISLGRFYIRRACRILPPYLSYLLVIGILAICGLVAVRPLEWVSCLLFFRNYLACHAFGSWHTAHFWSLAVEEHFYLLWPGLLVGLGISRARRLVVVFALFLAAWRWWDFRVQWSEMALPGVSWFQRTDIRLDGLLWGCWMALLLEVPGWKDRLARLLGPVPWFGLVAVYIGCVAFEPPLALLWRTIFSPAILVGTVLQPATLPGRVLEAAPMRWLGRLSYSLYVWQQLFLLGDQSSQPLPLGVFQEWPVNFIMIFACAMASFYLIEKPMIKWGHRVATPVPAGRI
jgi:peptidoglycan/LPS O-acetylase OafA/YrhL